VIESDSAGRFSCRFNSAVDPILPPDLPIAPNGDIYVADGHIYPTNLSSANEPIERFHVVLEPKGRPMNVHKSERRLTGVD
jgi:hypothetical protein